jgi:hypothetical protein
MPNSNANAAAWVDVLAKRPEIPFSARLKEHFQSAVITRLCDCGCNSFGCSVREPDRLQPLGISGLKGEFFEVAFSSDFDEPIDIVFYCDEQGCLSGIDIHFGVSNSGPMPEKVVLGKVLYTMPGSVDAL